MEAQQTTRLYIDNPWEDVERLIRETATDEIAEALDSAEDFAERIATRLASRVMSMLDGGEYEADRRGLRESS